MSKQYTSVSVWGGKILYRGIENGKRVRYAVDYSPTLFVASQKESVFKTIHKENVEPVNPGSIRECRDYISMYRDVSGFKIYGMDRFEYQFLADEFPDTIDWRLDNLHIIDVDIEVARNSSGGYATVDEADGEITMIGFHSSLRGRYFQFGCKPFNNNRDDVTYFHCRNEVDLLKRFVEFWEGDYPDIITGYNTEGFDIPYIINRIIRLLGESWAKRLSPWGSYQINKSKNTFGQEVTTCDIKGIISLDFMLLYRKFSGQSLDSYTLNNVTHVELGEQKIAYEEYGNLDNLYTDNYQLFVEYNARDIELVQKLENKLRLIELALTIAYIAKINFDDVFSPVRTWDCLIYNHLRKKNVVIPPMHSNTKESQYIGAYVKEPQVGMHRKFITLDLTSMYPSLIMQLNISPDTIIEPEMYDEVQQLIAMASLGIEEMLEKDPRLNDLHLTNTGYAPNGQFFRNDEKGFIVELIEQVFSDRKAYKGKMLDAQKEKEKIYKNDTQKLSDVDFLIARYNNLQMAFKILANALYGAEGTEYFRYFDIRLASAITTSGQLALRWIEKKVNEYMNSLLKTKDVDYVIYGDTDSIILSMEALVDRVLPNADIKEQIAFMENAAKKKIQPFIDSAYQELADYMNAYSQKMIMKLEKACDKGVFITPKHYVVRVFSSEGVSYKEPKIKITGLDMIKSSTPLACREKMKMCLPIIFDQTEDDMIDFIEDFREKFSSYSIGDISFPRGVNGMAKYFNADTLFEKKCPIHVRGSLVYNDQLKKRKLTHKYEKISSGDKIKYIYLKEPNPVQSNVVAFSKVLPVEFDLEKYIDYQTQFDTAFLKPLKAILDAISWKTERVSTLEAFFG